MRVTFYFRSIFFILLVPVCWAEQINIQSRSAITPTTGVLLFHFGRTSRRFLDFPDRRLTISENCGSKIEKMTCMAAQSLKLSTLHGTPPGKLASRNPGSVVCTEVLGARVVIGLDSHRNENSFCLFKDESIIDNGSLTHYAKTNDLLHFKSK